MNKSINYREKFKKYYGIDFSDDYEIHHIDLNHDNNDISNLMLLPSELHHKYHLCLSETLYFSKNKNERVIDVRLNKNPMKYNTGLMKELCEIIEECNIWMDYKLFIDGKMPNIHNIQIGE